MVCAIKGIPSPNQENVSLQETPVQPEPPPSAEVESTIDWMHSIYESIGTC
jgi:hypothetical protein